MNFIECGRMILEKIVSNNTGPICTPKRRQNSTFSGIICIGSFGNIHLKRVEDGGSLNICGTLLNYFVWLCVLHQENNNNQQRLDLARGTVIWYPKNDTMPKLFKKEKLRMLWLNLRKSTSG